MRKITTTLVFMAVFLIITSCANRICSDIQNRDSVQIEQVKEFAKTHMPPMTYSNEIYCPRHGSLYVYKAETINVSIVSYTWDGGEPIFYVTVDYYCPYHRWFAFWENGYRYPENWYQVLICDDDDDGGFGTCNFTLETLKLHEVWWQ